MAWNYKINYQGNSKVIKRICDRLNTLPGLGVTHEEAYYGDLGQAAYEHSQLTSGNPHNVTLTDLGIENIPNQIRMILDAIGILDSWIDYDTDDGEPIYMVDYDGDNLVFNTASDLLAWH